MIKEQLLSKNGTATLKLSRELLKYSVGEKIPTITDFSKQYMNGEYGGIPYITL